MRRSLFAMLLVCGCLAAASCSSDPTSPSTGQLTVYLTDAPLDLDGVSAVNVTFYELVLKPQDDEEDGDGGEMSIDLGPITVGGEATVNLLDYRDGNMVLMATGDLPVGDYEKLRMRISAAELVRDDDGDPETPDLVETIKVPSGKIDIPVPFTLSGGESMEVVLDFDAELSIHLNTTGGQHPYILRPVINVASSSAR